MGREISFWWDAEKRIRVAKAGEKNSLFYEAYRQALAGVAEIVRASSVQERNYDPFFTQPQQDAQNELRITCDSQYLYDYPNNIIVFSGERGAGKSSAMLTFVNSLKDTNGLLFQDEFLSGMVTCELPNVDAQMVKQMLKTSRFLDLPPIDPTTLEESGQILVVILARMFRLAANVWEEGNNVHGRNSSAKRLEEKNRLIQKFSTCYEHIQAIKRSGGSKEKPEYEGLETLSDLGDSSRLKVELYELVKQLLEFCLPDAGGPSYLVLQIDDTDMNIKKAYAILEDMRRYLVIPRLIIVMAADMKHLTQVVESSLLKDYDDNLDSRHEYVEKITHQYITKLFPQTRQIDLPALGTYFKEHTESIIIRYRIPGKTILPDAKENDFPSPQDQIIRLIYRKTGMVFLKQEHRLHPIIPCNMRLMAHFLSMLIPMEDVDDPDEDEPSFFLKCPDGENTYGTHAKKLRTRLQNIQRFRNYFLATWVNNSLDSRSVQIFKDLEEIDVADRIRYICAQLSGLWKAEEGPSGKPSENIIGDGQYADMVQICQTITERSWNEELKRLVFALQTYCSLFAQMLAVEDLADYYEGLDRLDAEAKKNTGSEQVEKGVQYGSGSTELGCSFSKLHMLFGSRLFPYRHGSRNEETMIELPDKKRLTISWKVTTRPSAAGFSSDQKERQYAMLLYTMLGDYQCPDGNALYFDLTKPITNCLYLGDGNGMTPFSASIAGAVPLNVTAIGEEPWHIMGNSSLITVLNCDVQMKIGAAIQRMIAEPRFIYPTGGEYQNWIARVKDLYAAMKASLGKQLPIKFLEKIDFSQWLEPIATKGIEAQDTPEHWANIVESLEAGITYTPPPPTEVIEDEDAPSVPPAGEKVEKTQAASGNEGKKDREFTIILEGTPPKEDKPDKPE